MAAGKPGQPTLFDANKAAIILETMARGHFLTVAAARAGVSRVTVWRWLKKGEREKTGELYGFCNAYKRAEAEGADKALAVILGLEKDADGDPIKVADWQRFAWFLERRFPKEWGRRTIVEDTRKKKKPRDQTPGELADQIREFLKEQNAPPPDEELEPST